MSRSSSRRWNVLVSLPLVLSFCLFLFLSLPEPISAVDRNKFRRCDQTAFCTRLRGGSNYAQNQKYHIRAETVSFDQATAKLVGDIQNGLQPLQPALAFTISFLAATSSPQVPTASAIRFTVKEKQGKYERYQVRDVVQDYMLQSPSITPTVHLTSTHAEATWTQVGVGESYDQTDVLLKQSQVSHQMKMTLQYNPFQLKFFVDNELVMLANSKNLMQFEQYRDRNPRPEHLPATPVSHEGTTVTHDGVQADHTGHSTPEQPPQQPTELSLEQMPFPYDEPGMWEESFGGHTDGKSKGPAGLSLDVSFPFANHVYGIPEHASSLALKGTKGQKNGDYTEPYRLYNLDVFEYELNEPMALYGAVPLILAHGSKATTGVFWLNAAETFVDISDSNVEGVDSGLFSSAPPQKDVQWISESGLFDVFFFLGPTPSDVHYQYATLTGLPHLPPLYSIGYHQCRWNYKNEEDVANVDAGFDQHDIPYDVLWLDIEHTDAKKYFTWDHSLFPNPRQMQENLKKKERRLVTIVDPHIKRDGNYHVHTEATSLGHYVKNKHNSDYEGWCWPGSASYLDFVQPEVRSFWAKKFSYDSYPHSTSSLSIWNDMNEPSVFNGPEVTMPKDNLHLQGTVEHRDVHNQYGMYVHMGTFQGLLERDNYQQRPFVLTRAFFAGSQRYAAVWTGDNTADWGHLAASQPMLLSHSIAQIPFIGADIGGFFKDPDAQLLARWYQAAIFHPFFRGHAHIDTKRKEPWVFGEPYTTIIGQAIKTRYSYLPFLYTLFYLNSQTGMTPMRPLWVHFSKDQQTFDLEDQYLVGSSILVKPVTQPDQSTSIVYLPQNPNTSELWYDLDTDKSYPGGQTVNVLTPLTTIPIFQRGGSIIPKKERARRSSHLMRRDPFTLVIALDAKGEAFGSLFMDDGISYNYKVGKSAVRQFKFSNNILSGTGIAPVSGSFEGEDAWIERVVILGWKADSIPTQATVSGVGANGETVNNKLAQVHAVNNNRRIVIRKPEIRVAQDFTISLA